MSQYGHHFLSALLTLDQACQQDELEMQAVHHPPPRAGGAWEKKHSKKEAEIVQLPQQVQSMHNT